MCCVIRANDNLELMKQTEPRECEEVHQSPSRLRPKGSPQQVRFDDVATPARSSSSGPPRGSLRQGRQARRVTFEEAMRAKPTKIAKRKFAKESIVGIRYRNMYQGLPRDDDGPNASTESDNESTCSFLTGDENSGWLVRIPK